MFKYLHSAIPSGETRNKNFKMLHYFFRTMYYVRDILNWSETAANLYDFYFSFTNFSRSKLRQFGFKFISQYQTEYINSSYSVSDMLQYSTTWHRWAVYKPLTESAVFISRFFKMKTSNVKSYIAPSMSILWQYSYFLIVEDLLV
jgi:hypothetical protein